MNSLQRQAQTERLNEFRARLAEEDEERRLQAERQREDRAREDAERKGEQVPFSEGTGEGGRLDAAAGAP